MGTVVFSQISSNGEIVALLQEPVANSDTRVLSHCITHSLPLVMPEFRALTNLIPRPPP